MNSRQSTIAMCHHKQGCIFFFIFNIEMKNHDVSPCFAPIFSEKKTMLLIFADIYVCKFVGFKGAT